ncbi:MAG: RNA repair domain-containing protein [Fervidicoccaceae archaeon]
MEIVKEIRSSKNKHDYKIYIIDRLAEGNLRVVTGNEITGITAFDQLTLEDDSTIPIHRIVKIEYKDKILIDRTTSHSRGSKA